MPVTTGNEGGNPMAKTLDELRSEYPDLTAQLEREARASAVAGAGAPAGVAPTVPEQTAAPAAPATATPAVDPVQAERDRIKAIDEIAPNILDKQMVEDAKYGEHPCSAQELAFRAMKNQAAQGAAHLANATADFLASGVGQVQTPAAPAKETDPDSPEAISAQAKADVAAFEKMKEVR